MRIISVLLMFSLLVSFTIPIDCIDTTIYVNEKQTKYDRRFDDYERIKGCPKYKGGDFKFEQLIDKNLKLSSEAKTQIFNLNYQFTVLCDGRIVNAKQMGDSRAENWTNIVEIIKGTEGQWTPAKKNDKPVSCIYFAKMFVDGGR